MTTPGPLLIVALPARSVAEALPQIEEAREAGADLAEIRFDWWRPDERGRAARLFPTPLPLIATYRSTAEGGEGSDEPEERLRVLGELEQHPFALIDREIKRDHNGAPVGPGRPGTILSRHMKVKTDAARVAEALMESPGEAAFIKVVVPATVGEALGPLLDALPRRGIERMVLHTTGGSGPLYRAWAWRLGFSAVYTALPTKPGRTPVEPAQIPVDDMSHFLSGSEPGPLFALVGHPVAHTRSPGLHNRWMRAIGEPGLYVALDVVSEGELADAVRALGEHGFRGLNVTRPWKRAALELASEIGPGARACGCANVLTLSPSGAVEAENTDLAALLRRLSELHASGVWEARRLTVLGNGGAARGVLEAARSLGVDATVVSRDHEAADRLAREFGATAARTPPDPPDDLLVNATPIGQADCGPPGIDVGSWLGPATRVVDMVYAPGDPVVRKTAEARGASYEDGWRLLVYQASESHAIWWGAPPPERELEAALRAGG